MLREYITQDIYVGLILVSLILVVSAKQLFNARFIDFVSVIWNDKYLKLYTRERKGLDTFSLLLSLNFVFSAGIFIYIAYLALSDTPANGNKLMYVCFGFIAALMLLKIGIERFVGYIFNFSEFSKFYIFQKTTYKNISAVVLILFNILLLFSNLDEKVVIYLGLTLLFLINLIGFIRFLKVYQKALLSHTFYFLLYLCALEIGPYVILYKVIKDYFG